VPNTPDTLNAVRLRSFRRRRSLRRTATRAEVRLAPTAPQEAPTR
jgi:hypothetical protein